MRFSEFRSNHFGTRASPFEKAPHLKPPKTTYFQVKMPAKSIRVDPKYTFFRRYHFPPTFKHLFDNIHGAVLDFWEKVKKKRPVSIEISNMKRKRGKSPNDPFGQERYKLVGKGTASLLTSFYKTATLVKKNQLIQKCSPVLEAHKKMGRR